MSIGRKEKISSETAKKLDVIMIIVLLVFAFTSYTVTNFVFKNNKSNIAVFVAGEKIDYIDNKKIDINVDGTYTIEDGLGGYNVIEIKDKKVRCIDANCPDKICVEHGPLNMDIDNDMIICAPHKLSIISD